MEFFIRKFGWEKLKLGRLFRFWNELFGEVILLTFIISSSRFCLRFKQLKEES